MQKTGSGPGNTGGMRLRNPCFPITQNNYRQYPFEMESEVNLLAATASVVVGSTVEVMCRFARTMCFPLMLMPCFYSGQSMGSVFSNC